MTLESILVLAQQARRSPHARRVLHDALLERYAAAYEAVLEMATAYARQTGVSQAILFYPKKLVGLEAKLRGQRRPTRFELTNEDVLEYYDIDIIRSYRHHYGLGASGAIVDEITVVVVRPPGRPTP